MKIGALNSAHSRLSKSPNFSGIWGKPKIEEDMPVLYDEKTKTYKQISTRTTTKYYYPFLNETDNHIKFIQREYSNHIVFSFERENIDIVKIMPKIPVTEAEYKNYVARKLLSKQEMEVEDKLKSANMQQFLNVPPKN